MSVLPYRFGTHSGWLEACYDVGTTVISPDCGYIAQQQSCLLYNLTADSLDNSSLVRAISTAYRDRPQWRADPRKRDAERAAIAVAHRRIYERALGTDINRCPVAQAGVV